MRRLKGSIRRPEASLSATLQEIDRIIAEHIVAPVGPEFMAPPSRASGPEAALAA
jgi:hypothetical protein